MSHNLNHTFEKRDILQPDINGFVEERFLRYVLVEAIRNSKLAGYRPLDADQYAILSGAPEEWADYFVATAKSSSNLNAFNSKSVVVYTSAGQRLDLEKVGLFSINPAEVVPNKEQLFIPRTNIAEAIQLYANRILKDKAIKPSDLAIDGVLEGGSNVDTNGFY
jgi:hypothetical protein